MLRLQYVAVDGSPFRVVGPPEQIWEIARIAMLSKVTTFVQIEDAVTALEEELDQHEHVVQTLSDMYQYTHALDGRARKGHR